ncbi:MAG: nuclear transport factor 2 family protein [Myxococcota bacterium]
MHLVQTKGENAKQQWVDLFSDDAIIEDPIGESPLDPEGKGHRGKEAIAAFWDMTIAMVEIDFELIASYACGREVANVGRIVTKTPDGGSAVCEGVFTYKVNEDGKILSLRAYWELDRMLASMKPPA